MQNILWSLALKSLRYKYSKLVAMINPDNPFILIFGLFKEESIKIRFKVKDNEYKLKR